LPVPAVSVPRSGSPSSASEVPCPSPRPSKSPEKSSTTATTPIDVLSTDVATYPARIAELLSPFKTAVTPAAHTWLEQQLSETKARSDGAEIASTTVLDAVIEATHIAQPAHDLSKRLNGYAHAVVSAHDTAHEERAALAAQYDSMNVLDGRILHELRALVGAMSDARKGDKSIPALEIAALGNRKRKARKATAAGGAEAPAAPAKTPPG
jgi:hypothetical protein